MNRGVPLIARKIYLLRVLSLTKPKRVTSKSLVAATLLVGLLGGSKANADSFFDVFVELWDSGQIVMQPVDSGGAFPFPPPPLNFPDLGATDTIDVEIVSLSLHGSRPLVVHPPSPTGGSFIVDSFFDITYEINATNGNGPPTHVVDSFFDIEYSMEVTPGRTDTLPTGELRTFFDTEMLSMSLSGSRHIDLPGDPDFDFAIQLVEGFAAGLDGHVTVLKLAGGGGFTVDSFFDVFVELSVDGGPPVPSLENSQLRLLSQNQVVVPEPATGGMVAFALLAVLLANRRRESMK